MHLFEYLIKWTALGTKQLLEAVGKHLLDYSEQQLLDYSQK